MGLGLAAGSRAHLEEKALSQRSWHRNLLMHGFHFLVLLVAGGAMKDTQCGFQGQAQPFICLYSALLMPRECSLFGMFL